MFSLIITIISIALAAALALATLYYGGNAFNKGTAESEATTLVNQVQQLQGARALYKAEVSADPLSLSALVSKAYLKSVPTYKSATWAEIGGNDGNWLPLVVNKEVCQAFNTKMLKTDGIPELPLRGVWPVHCFGTDDKYSIILQDAAVVSSSAIPASIDQAYTEAGVSFQQTTLPPAGIPGDGLSWSTTPTLKPWLSASAATGLVYTDSTYSFNQTTLSLPTIPYSANYRIYMYCPREDLSRYLFAQMSYSEAADGSTVLDLGNSMIVGAGCSVGSVANAVSVYNMSTDVTTELAIPLQVK